MLFLTSNTTRLFNFIKSLKPIESNLLFAKFSFYNSKNLSQIILTLILVNRLSFTVIDLNWLKDSNCLNYSSLNWQFGKSIYNVDWVTVDYFIDTIDNNGINACLLLFVTDNYDPGCTYYDPLWLYPLLLLVKVLLLLFLTLSNYDFNSSKVFSILVLAVNNSFEPNNKLVSLCCMSSITDCNYSFSFLYNFIFFYLLSIIYILQLTFLL